MYVDFRQRRTARDEQGSPSGTRRDGRSWSGSSATGRLSNSTTSSRRADRGLKLRPLQNAPGPEWEGHEPGRGADQGQRRAGRPRGRRPRLLQPQGRSGGAARAKPVPVAGRLHPHRAARVGPRHRGPQPAELRKVAIAKSSATTPLTIDAAAAHSVRPCGKRHPHPTPLQKARPCTGRFVVDLRQRSRWRFSLSERRVPS